MNLISEDYLMHHGVKGMKWGVRKTIQARKRYKKASESTRTKKVMSDYRQQLNAHDKKYGKMSERAWDKKHGSIVQSGRKAVLYSRLLDSGYSKQEAKVGSDWMRKKNWNLTISDDFWMYEDR